MPASPKSPHSCIHTSVPAFLQGFPTALEDCSVLSLFKHPAVLPRWLVLLVVWHILLHWTTLQPWHLALDRSYTFTEFFRFHVNNG